MSHPGSFDHYRDGVGYNNNYRGPRDTTNPSAGRGSGGGASFGVGSSNRSTQSFGGLGPGGSAAYGGGAGRGAARTDYGLHEDDPRFRDVPPVTVDRTRTTAPGMQRPLPPDQQLSTAPRQFDCLQRGGARGASTSTHLPSVSPGVGQRRTSSQVRAGSLDISGGSDEHLHPHQRTLNRGGGGGGGHQHYNQLNHHYQQPTVASGYHQVGRNTGSVIPEVANRHRYGDTTTVAPPQRQQYPPSEYEHGSGERRRMTDHRQIVHTDEYGQQREVSPLGGAHHRMNNAMYGANQGLISPPNTEMLGSAPPSQTTGHLYQQQQPTPAVAAAITRSDTTSSSSSPLRSGQSRGEVVVVDDTDSDDEELMDEEEAIRVSQYCNLVDVAVLGQGGQGVVWKCRMPASPASANPQQPARYNQPPPPPGGGDNGDVQQLEFLVRKEMLFADADKDQFKARLHQSRRFCALDHPHLMKYLAVIPTKKPLKLNVIMPYYHEKDMSAFIATQKSHISEYLLCSMILQVAQALDYLHTRDPPIVHRDVKPDNILLYNNGLQVMLMDFDAARSLAGAPAGGGGGGGGRVSGGVTSTATTMEYMAPEATQYGTVLPKNDIYSLGVVFFMATALADIPLLPLRGEMTVLGHHSWSEDDLNQEIRIAVRNCNPDYSDEIISIIQNMVVHDVKKRWSARHVANKLIDQMENLLMQGKGM